MPTVRKVFLSFSYADRVEAEAIYQTIKDEGGRAFLSSKDRQPGSAIPDRVREELKRSDEVWLLLSPRSLRSEWVNLEYGAAWGLGKTIVPILFDLSAEELPAVLRQTEAFRYHEVAELVERTFPRGSRHRGEHAADYTRIDRHLADREIIPATHVAQQYTFHGQPEAGLPLLEYIRDNADPTDENYYTILGNLGHTLVDLGRNREALSYYARVRTYNDGRTFFPWHAFGAAAAHLREGEVEEAKSMMRLAATLPNYDAEVRKVAERYRDLVRYIVHPNGRIGDTESREGR
jgi:hypothetical protein